MNISRLTIEKIIRDSGTRKDGTTWQRTDLVMRDLHSQVDTRFIARVQKRVLDTGIELREGDEWDVGIAINCHEYQGKYYNELSIWSMTPAAF